MKIKKIFIAIAALGMTFTSCDDYLTRTNPNELTTELFWQNINDCNKGLNSVYNIFTNENLMALSIETKRSDLALPGYKDSWPIDPFYNQTFTDADKYIRGKWDAAYQGVFRTNQVIIALDDIAKEYTDETDAQTLEKWTHLMAQARFFRGYFYFVLHSSFNYGSVPLIDYIPNSMDQYFPALAESKVVKEFYEADLMYAANNLPQQWGETAEKNDYQQGRVKRGAALAVLGKSALYAATTNPEDPSDVSYSNAEQYDLAKTYFETIIKSGNYSLTDLASIGTTYNEFNSESILEVAYSTGHKTEESAWSSDGVTNTLAMLVSPNGGWRGIIPCRWLTMEYMKDQIDMSNDINWNMDPVTGERVSARLFSWRASHYISLVEDDFDYYGKAPVLKAGFNNGEVSYFRKNSNWDIWSTEKDAAVPSTSGINYRVIRLADVYLMYAESCIKGGTDPSGLDEALKYINKVRNRSYLRLLGYSSGSEYPGVDHDEVLYDAESLMEHLMMVERPLELAGEGNAIRSLDLRRWGITKERLQELSTKVYHADNYEYFDEDGKKQTRWASIIKEGPHPQDPGKYNQTEFVQAANNYSRMLHGWFPIPSEEKIANPNIN